MRRVARPINFLRMEMGRKRALGSVFVFVVFAIALTSQVLADEPQGLTLADLAAYRSALDGKPAGEPIPVSFRQLWERPDDYKNKRVQVEGRVVRRFQQWAFGTFPPLVEAWAVTPSGDPFCLVYPMATMPDNKAAPGALIRFEGTYLKPLEYQGSDAKRLAPLIVGDRIPTVLSAAKAPAAASSEGIWKVDWALGLGAAALVALALARQHLRSPSRTAIRKNRDLDPPPEFVDAA